MPEYKLIYFNLRGRAELTRLMFAYGGIPFVDERIEKADWPARKSGIPGGKLPLLMIDGKPLPQSLAIARYAAKEAGLVPQDNLQAAYCDAVVDTMGDVAMELHKTESCTTEEEKKQKFKEVYISLVEPVLARFEKELSDKEWIVGDKITWADVAMSFFGGIQKRKPDFLTPFPKVLAHVQKVLAIPQIKEWMDKSPKTDM